MVSDRSAQYVRLRRGCHLWHQQAGGWGMSNAGLVVGRDQSLLIDTLYDLRLTRRMLDAFAEHTEHAPVTTLVNTHGNGDHWFGNELVPSAEIVAARGSLADMLQVQPPDMLRLTAAATPSGLFARSIFDRFEFTGITPRLPDRLFDRELTLDIGGTCVRLIDVGPAHTAGDTIVHVPHARTVYTGDIVFAGGTPVVWHGPFDNWIAACELILGLDVQTVVPGHGPVTTKAALHATRAYLEYVHDQASARFAAGMTVGEATRTIPLGRFAELPESERLAVNVHTVYRELDPGHTQLDGPDLFGCMAELACPQPSP
ncbi:MBL fold metallo-hydrolase [Streptomyces sp. NBC_00988]|uniref:MBL fold metallo-hydrolase n=1 Tax=Streptomyces sp. NBC_00988 TaxID=2903704 RepID=UPI00386E6E17|nr:MBL fold metallo-hydrolase [Streptomyces sp. NBC_00988]